VGAAEVVGEAVVDGAAGAVAGAVAAEVFPEEAGASAVAAQEDDGNRANMKPTTFLNQLNERQIVDAIRAAERRTSGEIRVFVANQPVADAVKAAVEQFEKLGMTRTKLRNGVLIYFAPVTRNFAIVGDSGIHEKCGEVFWRELGSAMTKGLEKGETTTAITGTIQKVGNVLTEHFPRTPDDLNELPDAIAGE
jgi:uncharacterized membrane protein